MNKFKLNLQMFAGEDAAETNATLSADLEPAISIDLTSRMTENINTLKRIISANELIPMASGSVIKMYKTVVKNKPAKMAGEGEVIGLTELERKLVNTVEMKLNKYRKQTPAEAIQKTGRNIAINETDEALIKSVQKEIKADFFKLLGTGTGTATATANGLQGACAAAWGKVQEVYEDVDATPIYFIHPTDAANYLATAQVTMQTAFGLSYIENFLGLGDAFVSPAVAAGNVFATAKENLYLAYVPADNGDVADTFNLISDETGLIGMTHSLAAERASVDTLVMTGVKFYPEDVSKIIKVPVTAASAPAGE